MARQILIKPILTEKSDRLSNTQSQYSFVVDRKSNKIEIKKAVQDMYSVSVQSVNTIVVPGKTKSRNSRAGMIKGRKAGFKKAIVTLATGEKLDFFGDI
jgi:large subunit ribosomal protein L23